MAPRKAIERAASEAGARRDRALRASGAAWKERGVVHTPSEVARFVVRRVDATLRASLSLSGGIADARAHVVDPACGPGAFLAALWSVAGGRRRHGPPGAVVGLDVDADAVAAAEALMAPAVTAGWPLTLRVADTLADLDPFPAPLPTDGVAVVLGNPPWAGRTANRGAEATGALLEDFRRDAEGRRLEERKLGVLSDDYVRFWRWACEVARLGPAGGVVGLVTNGSFLDGPVHRGMRAALARWFDGVEVVDLGGSALVARRGARDENVFGVRPSVAVTIAWRAPCLDGLRRARVRYASVRGRREDKLSVLDAGSLDYESLACRAPGHLLRPGGTEEPRWAAWPSLASLVPFHREGVQTNRDAVVVDACRERLLERLRAFADGIRREDLEVAWRASGHYDPDAARAAVAEALERDPTGEAGIAVRPIAYRPFDVRWFAPISRLCHRARPALLEAIDRGGPVLLTVRKDRGDRPWSHAGLVHHVPDNCWLSARSSCRTRAFTPWRPDGSANLDSAALETWAKALDALPGPEAVLEWALGILASPGYRRAFDGVLRLDYPRLPPPPNGDAFERVRAAARALGAAMSAPVGDGPEVQVGHWTVRSEALLQAVERVEEAVAPVLEAEGVPVPPTEPAD